MKIRPLADRVVIKKFEAEEKTASGIVLPTAAKEQPQMAEVKMEVKVGDKVIFSKYAGNEIKADGENYIILRQSDILAIVEL